MYKTIQQFIILLAKVRHFSQSANHSAMKMMETLLHLQRIA